jgi:hypothetical protein
MENRYKIQVEPDGLNWMVVDRLSGKVASSIGMSLLGLDKEIAECWVEAMNLREMIRLALALCNRGPANENDP